jgi:glutathione S-transferase
MHRYPTFSKTGGPNFQALVEAYGGPHLIPLEAWRRFDRQVEWWQQFRLAGGLHGEPNYSVLCRRRNENEGVQT